MAKALNVSLAVTADTGQAKAALQQLQQQLTQLTASTKNISFGGSLKQGADEAIKSVAQLQTMLKTSTNTMTGNLDLTKFNQQIKASGMSLSDYKQQLSLMGTAGNKAFAQLANSISQAEIPIRRSSAALKEMGTVLQNTIRWQLSSSLIHGFMGTMQHALSYAQDLNESLNKIQIVTQASDEHMANFAKSANEAAKRLSTTTTTYTDASLIYYQQGLSDKEVAERTEVTIKMANAAGVSAQKVSDQMTAVWNNFDDGSHSLEYYADVMTALGAATASSTDEISTGLSKFASVADTVGLSYENAAAALATITATTRNSADTVGTGLRTLFSRLQSVKLGETLEDGVDLTKYSAAIATMGVNILDVNGELKSMDQIIDEMGAKWQYLNNTQKTAIAQTVGGVRQYTNLIALLDNYDFYKQNQQIALNSEGTVQQQADIYAKSWEAAQKRVKASAESIYSDLLNDDFFIEMNNALANTLDYIHDVIEGFGGLKGVLLTIGTIASTSLQGTLAKGLTNIAYDLKTLTPKGRQEVYDLRAEGAKQLANIGGPMGAVYAQQGKAQATYAEVAPRLTAEQQMMAQFMMQQQAEQIKDVERANDQLKKVRLDNGRKMSNTAKDYRTATGNIQGYGNIKSLAETLGKSEGRIESFFNSFGEAPENVDQVKTAIEGLKLSLEDFGNISDTAKQGFEELQQAMADYEKGPSDAALATVKDKFQSLANIFYNDDGSFQEDKFKNLLQQLGIDLDNSDVAEVFDKIKNGAREVGEAEGEAAIRSKQLEASTDSLTQKMRQLANTNYSVADTLVAFGNLAMSIMMVTNNVKQMHDIMTDDSIETFGEKLAQIAPIALMTGIQIGNMFKNLGPLLSFGGKVASTLIPSLAEVISQGGGIAAVLASLSGLAAVLAPIAVVIGLIVNQMQRIDSTADRIKRLNNELDSSKEAASNAKAEYDDLISAFGAYDEAINKTSELTEGTNEYAAALADANAQARELIKNYGLSSSDWTYENGQYKITDEARERLINGADEKVQATRTAEAAAEVRAEFGNVFENFRLLTNMYEQQQIGLQEARQQGRTPITADQAANAASALGFASYKDFAQAYATEGTDLLTGLLANSTHFDSAIKDYILQAFSNATGDPDSIAALANIYGKNSVDLFSEMMQTIDQEGYTKFGWLDAFLEKDKTAIEDYQEAFKDLDEEAYNNFLNSDKWKEASSDAERLEVIQTEYRILQMQKGIQQKVDSDLAKYSNLLDKAGRFRQMSAEERQQTISDMQSTASTDSTYLAILEQLSNQYETTGNNLAQAIGSNSNYVLNEETSKALFKNMSLEEINGVADIVSKFGSSFGRNATTDLTSQLFEQLTNNDRTLLNELKEVSLTGDRITDYASMRKIGERSNSQSVQKAINELINTSMAEQGGKAGLFEELYGSENFKDNLKAIQKQFKKTGKIGGDAIEGMAESSEYLSDFLESSGMNAETLADILNSIETGNIGIDQLSDQLIDAFSAASALENSLAQTFSYIDNFQQERSVRDIGKFYKGLSDSVKEGWESGMLLDPQLTQAWGEMFGTKSLAEYRRAVQELTDDTNRSSEEISKALNSQFADEVAAMQSIQKYGDLSGMFEYYDKKGGFSDMFSFKNGQVVAADIEKLVANNWDSIEGFISELQERGVEEHMARAMANEYAATNGTINKLWRSTAAREGLDILTGTDNGEKVVTTAELKAFYNEYSDILSDMYGFTPDENGFKAFMEQMKGELSESGKVLADLGSDFDYAKASLASLTKAFADNGGDLNKYLEAAIGPLKDGEVYTIDELSAAYERLGIAGTQAYKIIGEQITESGKSFQEYVTKDLENAQLQWEDFTNYLESKHIDVTKATNEQLASEFAQFLDNSQITSQMEASARSIASAIQDAFVDLFESLQITFDGHTFEITIDKDKLAKDATEAAQKGLNNVEVNAAQNKDSSAHAFIEQERENTLQRSLEQEAGLSVKLDEAFAEEIAALESTRSDSLAEIADALADLETAKADAISGIAETVATARAELAEASQLTKDAITALNEGNTKEAEALLAQAETHAAAAKEAANNAKAAADEAKAAQQEVAQEVAKAAQETAQAAESKVAEMENMISSLEAENQNYVSLLQEASDTAQAAIKAAGEAATAATEGNLAAAEEAAARAEEAAARAEGIVATIQSKVDGQMTFEGETPTYTKEEQQGFTKNAWGELKQDFQNIFQGISDALVPPAYGDELTEAEQQMNQLGETANTVANDINGNPIHNEVDNTAIEDSIDALERLGEARNQLGQEAEANPVQLHASADVNDPDKAPGVYESYGLDYPDAVNEIAKNTEKTAENVEKQTNQDASQFREENRVVDSSSEGGKPQGKAEATSITEKDFVAALRAAGITDKDSYEKARETAESKGLAELPYEIASAMETVIQKTGSLPTAERVSQVQTQQVETEARVRAKFEEIDTSAIENQEIPVVLTAMEVVNENEEDTQVEAEMYVQTSNIDEARAEIEDLGGQILEETVDGDITRLKVAIDGQNARQLIAYVGGDVSALAGAIGSQDGRHITVTVDYEEGDTSGLEKAEGSASGRNNGNGRFATGKHLGNKYQGLAEVGELGPELMLHRGMPFLAGVNGRTVAYVEPDDEIYTAAQTKRILENNPTLQDLPGFSVGYNRVTWGNSGGGGGYGSGAKSSNKKSAKFDPERYHLISRQIDDINRRYERLDKISDKAFGKNKVKAIQDIIDVTDDLIAAQEQLISEANAYVNQDLATLRAYGVPVTLDEHGNLQNFEQLQEMYGRPATEAEDNNQKEYYQTIWKAIQQYEESVDKLNEAYEKYDDLIYQLAELELEQFTARVEMKIDYDDKSLKLLDHYIDKINDDIYKTAEVFELTESKLNTNLHKLDSYYDGIEKIMMTLHDQDGNLIKGMSLDKFLGLTDAQRDALRVSSEDMEAIADYLEEMVDVMEEMDDEKLDWTEKLSQAFDELNEKVENGLNLFDHYQSLLENLSNISDLMGTGITPQSRKLLKDLNIGLLRNTQNSMIAAKDYLDSLEQAAAQTKWLVMNESDTELKQAYQEQLDEIEGMIRDTQENILSYWETMLEMAQDMYTNAIDQALQDYERSFAGLYVTLDRMGEAYDRRKEIQSQYVEDYEKYYQLSKLDRDIVKTIDELAANASKHSKNLTDLLNEVRELQKNGQKLSEYDIEVLEKKYELEKARAELEEAREAKTTVRLQRNRDGSWGYVYTADEDKISELEANLEEAIYNYQKLNDEQIHRLQDNMADFVKTMHDAVNDIMSDTTTTYEEKMFQLQELNKDFISQQGYLFSEINKAMNNQGSTYSRALDIYKGKTSELGDAFVDLEDTFAETVLAQILGVENLDVYKSEMTDNWNELLDTTKEALDEYQARVDDINKTAGTTTKNFYDDATKWIEAIGKTSGETTSDVQKLGDELSTQFKRIAEEAKDFAAMWKEKMREVTEYTEPFVTQLTSILGIMNDAYDAFGIADGTAGQVYADRIVGSGRNNNGNITASDNGPASVYNPYADIEAQYLALQQQLEDQYAAYQNEILNYYNDVQNNIAAALGDLTNNWNSILNTQSSLMGYGLNTTPNLAGLMGLDSGWNQNINIAADFPGVTSSFEIEEAFNNLVNKATQYANRW